MQATSDPWDVVSHLPQGSDPWAVVAHKAQASPQQPEDTELTNMMGHGMPSEKDTNPADAEHPAMAHGVASFLHAIGLPASADEYKSMADADAKKTFWEKMKDAPLAGPGITVNSLQAAGSTLKRAGSEQTEAFKSTAQGDLKGAAAHQVGALGYGAAGLLTPVGGQGMVNAGEQFGKGDVSGGVGTTAGLLAPLAVGKLLPSRITKPLAPAADVLPKHVEALTGLIEDKGGTVDPHETASAALPHLRETAVRMKLDPSQLKGREAGQATLKVAEQAVRDTQNEFNTIKKPYENVLVEQKPIADAYRAAITPELLANEPKIATALEKQAKKFDQPAPLEQVNQFRTRMNNQLDAFEKRGQTAQIMSDIETKAMKAAANAARDVEYSTVGRMSGIDPEYVRALKQKEGSLIEAKSSLEKEYNRASGNQGEAASKGIREKVASTYPSPRGIKHVGIKELIGPKPIDVLNNRIQKMFADMGTASPLPEYQQVMPPEAPQPQGGASGPLPGGEDAIEEATRGGPGSAATTTSLYRGLDAGNPIASNRAGTFFAASPEIAAKYGSRVVSGRLHPDTRLIKAQGNEVKLLRAGGYPEGAMASMEDWYSEPRPHLSGQGEIVAGAKHLGYDGVVLNEHLGANGEAHVLFNPDKSFISDQTFARPSKMGTQQGIADQVTAAKAGKSTAEMSRVDQHKVSKAAIGEQVQAPTEPAESANAYEQAKQVTAQWGKASPSLLQRKLKIGYKDVVALQDRMKADGLIDEQHNWVGGSQPQTPAAPTVENDQITQAHVDAENAFYTQARAELGANAEPSAVLARAQALKIEHVAKGAAAPTTPVPPTVRPTLTQKMQIQPLPKLQRIQPPAMPHNSPQSPSGASRQSQVAATMLLLKNGQISENDAYSRINKLIGSGGRRTMRMPVRPE